MIHPILMQTTDKVNNLEVTGEILQKLLDKPRPILWKCSGVYWWVPIEKVKNSVRWYIQLQKTIYPSPDKIVFIKGDCVVIPKEAGETIFKYNGHEND